jgi:hypothetical protein
VDLRPMCSLHPLQIASYATTELLKSVACVPLVGLVMATAGRCGSSVRSRQVWRNDRRTNRGQETIAVGRILGLEFGLCRRR